MVRCQPCTYIYSLSFYLGIRSTKMISRYNTLDNPNPCYPSKNTYFLSISQSTHTSISGLDQPIRVLDPSKIQNPMYNSKRKEYKNFIIQKLFEWANKIIKAQYSRSRSLYWTPLDDLDTWMQLESSWWADWILLLSLSRIFFLFHIFEIEYFLVALISHL